MAKTQITTDYYEFRRRVFEEIDKDIVDNALLRDFFRRYHASSEWTDRMILRQCHIMRSISPTATDIQKSKSRVWLLTDDHRA